MPRKDRPDLPKAPLPYEGAITAKIENASFNPVNKSLMGVMVGSSNLRQGDGQFIVTTAVTAMLGTDLYRVADGSVYIVEWQEEDSLPMTTRVVDAIEFVRPPSEAVKEPWHFVYRHHSSGYQEDCWKWYSNGPTEYWKRMEGGYLTPAVAYAQGWRYGGVAVW